MAIIKLDGGFVSLPVNIQRGNPVPLDKTSIWYTFEELQAYAQSAANAYVGQLLVHVDKENSRSDVYVIANEAGALTPIGQGTPGSSSVNVDNQTIVLGDGDLLALKDFGKQYYRYTESGYVLQQVTEEYPWKEGLLPQVAQDANDPAKFVLAWYEPNPTTVDGLSTLISGLQDEVDDVKTDLANNYYTKTEADAKFAGVLHYKGLLDTEDELDSKTDAAAGDFWIIRDTGAEFVYNGTTWEELGSPIDLSALETQIESNKTEISTLKTQVSNLSATVNDDLKPTVNTLSTEVGTLKSQVSSLKTKQDEIVQTIGTPKTDEAEATGLYKVITDEIATLSIQGATIEGTDAPVVKGKVELYAFTNEKATYGLVKRATDVAVLQNVDSYVLSAGGNWVQPQDSRIGTLTHNEVQYTNVTEYVDARIADSVLTWSAITEE